MFWRNPLGRHRCAFLPALSLAVFLSSCATNNKPPESTAAALPKTERNPSAVEVSCVEFLKRILTRKSELISELQIKAKLGVLGIAAKASKITAGGAGLTAAGVGGTAYLSTGPRDATTPGWQEKYSSLIKKHSESVVVDKYLPHVAMIGDSLSTAFYLSDGPSMVWRMWTDNGPNLFIDRDPDPTSVYSFFERLSAIRPVYVKNYARPAATIYKSRATRGAMMNFIGNIQPLDGQVDSILAEKRFPDLVLMWIGHNNMDWAGGYNPDELDTPEKQDIILQETREQIRANMEFQILKLINQAMKERKRFALIVYGIGNFDGYFKVRAKAEAMHNSNPDLYPYVGVSQDHMITIRPEYRERLLQLVRDCNEDTHETVRRLQESYKKYSNYIYLEYSDILAKQEPELGFLHHMDGWHFNNRGHSALAHSLFESAQPALEFLKIK